MRARLRSLWHLALASVLFMLALAGAASAQEVGTTAPNTGAVAEDATAETRIFVLDQERLLSQSQMGQRIQRELAVAGRALAAENRSIEAQLTAEELELTDMRARVSVADFTAMASEFDSRVEAIRRAQEAKSRALQSQAEAAQALFFDRASPVLLELVRSRGADVLLDSRFVLLSSDGVDITDVAVAEVDAVLGDGGPDPLIDIDGTAE